MSDSLRSIIEDIKDTRGVRAQSTPILLAVLQILTTLIVLTAPITLSAIAYAVLRFIVLNGR